MILAITFLEKLYLKPPDAAFSTVFFRRIFRPKADSDVISGVGVEYIGMNVRATYGESGLNTGRIILLYGRPHPFYASLLCSI